MLARKCNWRCVKRSQIFICGLSALLLGHNRGGRHHLEEEDVSALHTGVEYLSCRHVALPRAPHDLRAAGDALHGVASCHIHHQRPVLCCPAAPSNPTRKSRRHAFRNIELGIGECFLAKICSTCTCRITNARRTDSSNAHDSRMCMQVRRPLSFLLLFLCFHEQLSFWPRNSPDPIRYQASHELQQ